MFAKAKDSRASEMAQTLLTFAAGFGIEEAARQRSGSAATKTWVTLSRNPRPSHAAMDGETVGIDEVFSNGMKRPGDGGDPNEVAGCTCEIDVTFP